ncbi:MAG TPA: UDP-glucose 6-dehydrogenase [Candidatus Paceibacterota bacterium]|nr:UDP-glucose 6-dehydrogenase [Candidatus Paceibacterota bacterium]
MAKFKKNILCIGAGYVGGPTMAVIAAKCPDYKVTVVDINKDRIKAWKTDNLPIYEPGLLEIVKKARGKNLFFSTDVEKEIKENEIIFVSVNTPTKTFGEGAGKAADLQYWEKTARNILKNSESDKIIIEKSTLPVRTAEAMERILNSGEKKIHFEVLSSPEFLAEGTAIKDLLNPDRVLVGSRETPGGIKARNEIVEIYANWIPKEKILTTNVWSSELSKLVANAFLAQRISSINAISALCEKTEADVDEISRAIGHDSRIGAKFLRPSIGFGGSCFKKDILNLSYIAESYGLHEVAEYWQNVIKLNDYQAARFVKNMLKSMFNTVAGKKIALFGFAFKANTGDTRETPALAVTKMLLEERAEIIITDPKALHEAKRDLADIKKGVTLEEDVYKAAKGSHAIAIMTEWDSYKTLDYEKIYKSMEKPAFIFDGRNILNHKKLYDIGFNVYPIGKTPLSHL